MLISESGFKDVQNLIAVAITLIDIFKENDKISRSIESQKNEFQLKEPPIVQLYGLSQAGKSTLMSCLTLGEQYIPIGTGRATTAVKVELVESDQHYAEVDWFSPSELFELVTEPIGLFIKKITNEEKLAQTPTSLESPEDRNLLHKLIKVARNVRQDENSREIGGGNDLAISEIILRHWTQYFQAYSPESQIIEDFLELANWTRQPYDWGDWEKRPISKYSFDELRSFFTKKVRLYVPTQEVVRNLYILDTPGFGISNLHDCICRNAQDDAEAVILIAGRQFTKSEMQNISRLATGLQDNIFVVWNPQEGNKKKAQSLLKSELLKLKDETGIVIPEDRTVVVNLHLALRAMQWERIQNNIGLSTSTQVSLDEIFSRNSDGDYHDGQKWDIQQINDDIFYDLQETLKEFTYERRRARTDTDKLSKALDLSGWHDLVTLLKRIRTIREQERNTQFAISLLNSMILFLESFPTPREKKLREETLKVLKLILSNIEMKRGDIRENMQKKISLRESLIFDEFLSYLVNENSLKNLKSNINSKIHSELHFSTIPSTIINLVKDYSNTRCSVWSKDFKQFKTPQSSESILGFYKKAIFDLEEWICEHPVVVNSGSSSTEYYQISLGEHLGLELPSISNPEINFGEFRNEFSSWNNWLASSAFSPDWLDSFINWLAETGNEASYQARRFGNEVSYQFNKIGGWFKSVFTEEEQKDITRKETEKRPSFDKNKAINSVEDKLRFLLSKETFENVYEIGKNPTVIQDISDGYMDPNNIISWLDRIERQIDIYQREVLISKCQQFCYTWRKGRDTIKGAVNDSFSKRSISIQSTLQDRFDRLKDDDKPLLDQTHLMAIEKTVEQINSIHSLNSRKIKGNIEKARRLIAARKE